MDAMYQVREITDFRDMLDQSVVLFGNEPAFKIHTTKEEYRTVNFKEFRQEVRVLGTVLTKNGLQGQRIAVMGANSYEWCLVYMAVTTGGGTIVPVDKELPYDEVLNILKTAECKTILLDAKAYKKLQMHPEELPEGLEYIVWGGGKLPEGVTSFEDYMKEGVAMIDAQDPAYGQYLAAKIDPDAMSVLIFTSGTSGMAKGVMLSQHNICFVVMSNSSVADIHPGDQMLAVLPLHHTFECSLGFLAPIYNGCCNAFCDSIMRLPKELQAVSPTVLFTVPLMVEKLHDRILRTAAKQKGGKFKLAFGKGVVSALEAFGINASQRIFKEIIQNFGGRLRLFIIGAAAIRPEVVADFKKFGITSYLGYGLTECAPLVSCNNDGLFTVDSVGKVIPGVEVKLLNPNEEGIGELLVRGPNVMLGYFNDEEQTKEVLDEDGWFHTGDLGSIDEEGLIRLHGRSKNVIVTKNGKNIYPEELEDQLNRSPFIAESMVVGEDKDEKTGTIVSAKIFPDLAAIREALGMGENEMPTAEQIGEFIQKAVAEINERVPSYKTIKEYAIRNTEFIKTTTAKIKRYANMVEEAVTKPAEAGENAKEAESPEGTPTTEPTEGDQ